jgi:hypothetical protein
MTSYYGKPSITQWAPGEEEDEQAGTWSWGLLFSDRTAGFYDDDVETRWYIMFDSEPFGILHNKIESYYCPRNWFNA